MLAAFRLDVAVRAQLGENLLEEFNRQFLFGGELGDLQDRTTEFLRDPQIDQGAERVFAAFGKIHSLVAK